ncbi:MAG: hypothetical protein KKD36_11895 [Bacteroidetes bacterium]|nr:hypothetical protein [Bacteroidota bacterium]
MAELSDKEKEVLDFLLDFIHIEIFSIEQQERDLGRLDYSLCSDDNEKQTITIAKVEKLKKRIRNCNPVVATYLNCLITPDPLKKDFEELVDIITTNFLLTEYYELFEELVKSDLKDIENYNFKSIIKSLGYKYKPLKEFIQGVCDVNNFFTYQSFLDIPQNTELHYDKVMQKLNDAFFKLEAFMNGVLSDYNKFDFNTSFTELFYLTRKSENYTYENCKRIGQYWELTEQIRVDYDKSNFKNEGANNNKAFCHDCNEITSIAWDRIEEFNSFQTPDEVEEQTRKKSISDLIKPTTTIQEVIEVKIQEQESNLTSETNPYPRIFTSNKAFDKFNNLYDQFKKSNQDLANYSFVYHRMKKDNLIFKDVKQLEFIDLLSSLEINLDRLKPISQLGNNDFREGIYNRI